MTHHPSRTDRNLTRRSFCKQAAAALAATAVGTQGTITAAQTDRPALIDVHVHLGQPWATREPLTADVLLRWMDEHDISHAVVLPLISPEAWYYPITTEWVLKETKPHRDRLLPFCDIDPRTDYLGGYKGYLDTLRRYVDAGAVGFGEHKCGTAIDDPRNLEVFHAASELKLPILFHMDKPPQHGPAGPARPGKGPPGGPQRPVHRPCPGLVGLDFGRRESRSDGHLSQDPGSLGRRHRPPYGEIPESLRRLLGRQRRQFAQPRSGVRPRVSASPCRSTPVRDRLSHPGAEDPAVRPIRAVRLAGRGASKDLPWKRRKAPRFDDLGWMIYERSGRSSLAERDLTVGIPSPWPVIQRKLLGVRPVYRLNTVAKYCVVENPRLMATLVTE